MNQRGANKELTTIISEFRPQICALQRVLEWKIKREDNKRYKRDRRRWSLSEFRSRAYGENFEKFRKSDLYLPSLLSQDSPLSSTSRTDNSSFDPWTLSPFLTIDRRQKRLFRRDTYTRTRVISWMQKKWDEYDGLDGGSVSSDLTTRCQNISI